MEKVFRVSDREWRGIGNIPSSGYRLRDEFALFDAGAPLSPPDVSPEKPSECISGQVLQGWRKPVDCPAFASRCTPEHPRAPPWFPPRAPARPITDIVDRTTMATEFAVQCPLPWDPKETITLAHGGGGLLSQRLFEQIFKPRFDNPILGSAHDAGILPIRVPLSPFPLTVSLFDRSCFPAATSDIWRYVAR
jgi:hypothetical protein